MCLTDSQHRVSSVNAAMMFPHLRQERVTPADFPIAPGVLHHTKKQRNTTFPETELPDGSGDYGPPDVPRGPPGARSPGWAPQLEATLAFPPF